MLTSAGDGRQAQPAALGVAGAAGGGHGLVEQAERPAGLLGEGHPGPGEPQAPPLTGDEGDPDLALEAGQGGRHRRLGDHQALGGGADRAGVGDGQKAAQLTQSHK